MILWILILIFTFLRNLRSWLVTSPLEPLDEVGITSKAETWNHHNIVCTSAKCSKTSYRTSVGVYVSGVRVYGTRTQVFVRVRTELLKGNWKGKNVLWVSDLLTLLVRSLSWVVNWSRRLWTSPVGCKESNRDSTVLNRLSTSPRF